MVAARRRAISFLAGISLVLTISTRTACAQSFKSTGSMTTGRIGHTATLLNGGKVLVTAGVGPTFNYIGSAELYDPSTDLGHRRYATRHQIVEPAVRPSDSFQQGRIRLLRLSPIAIHYESQLDTPPFDLHRCEFTGES